MLVLRNEYPSPITVDSPSYPTIELVRSEIAADRASAPIPRAT
jgi:hypothetical protein